MEKVLITGFEPFGEDSINPSLEVLKLLDKHTFENCQLKTLVVPVVKTKSIEKVTKAIEDFKPTIVINLGQAGGREGITPERVAINVDDYRIPDNDGNVVVDKPVVQGAADGYFSTLPIKAMVKAMSQEGITSSVSNTAGTFVCNHLFFGVQHFIRENNLDIRHGFIHIPLIPEQKTNEDQPAMEIEVIKNGLIIAISTAVNRKEDIEFSSGTIC